MNARDLNRYKRLLLAKQRELSAGRAVLPAAGGAQGDLIDEANLDSEAELQITIRQTDVRLLRAIEDALTRAKKGTFGICEVCRRPISRARLEAVPWARLCLNCKEREHA
jgi:DnaK suppressor protein